MLNKLARYVMHNRVKKQGAIQKRKDEPTHKSNKKIRVTTFSIANT